MIKWIKDKWNDDLVMYRLLFWMHATGAVIESIRGAINGDVNYSLLLSSIIIAMLSSTIIKGMKNEN
jgi:hypothetical protein